MVSLRRLALWAATVLLFSLVVGCGGGGGGGNGGLSPTNFTLKSGVVELDKSAAQVVSVSPDSVVLTGAPSLAPGNVIIHNALDDTRFLRKVESVTTVGDATTVTTSPAGVEDVFEKAAILQQSPAPASELLKMQPAQEGLTIEPGGSARPGAGPKAAADDIVTLRFANMQLKDDSNNAIVEISGAVTVNAGVETKFIKSGLSVQEFVVAPYLGASGTLTARGRASGSFSKEFPLSLGVRIPVTPLGPLGITTTIQLKMRVEGSYSAQGQFVLTANVFAKEGVQYKNGQWSLINQFDKNFDMAPPTLQGQLEMGVSLVRPQIGADILGIGEVHVTADVVKAIARLTARTAPVPGIWIEGKAKFGFTAGGSLRIGPLTLWEDSRSFDLAEFDIVRPFLLPSLSPSQTYIAFTDLALRNLHAIDGDGGNDRILVSANTALYSPNICNRNGKLCYGKFNAGGRGEIWTCNKDGSGQTRITDGTLSVNHLSWRPDGTEIAFDASDSNNVKQVYVVNLQTRNVRQLTDDATASRIPCWTPDGGQIYFEHLGSAGKKVIARTLSDRPTFDIVLANDTIDYAEPSLSPNGLQLACLRGGFSIVVSDERGRDEHPIISDSHLSRPVWSPDGLRLVMQYNDINTTKLLSSDSSGGDQRWVSEAGLQPTWGLRN